jgi:deazaflavin-dependent oxidoreductase (nitroreductase family)
MDYEAFTQALMTDLRANGRPSGGPMAGKPLMILTTTGARTGQPRQAIVTFTRDADRFVIAASKSGAPTNPAWYHNLVTHPDVTVEADGETFTARATPTSGPERDRLWDRHADQLPEFREYPSKTTRVIPVVVLERVTD